MTDIPEWAKKVVAAIPESTKERLERRKERLTVNEELTDVDRLVAFAKLLFGEDLLPWQIEVLKAVFDPKGPQYNLVMLPGRNKSLIYEIQQKKEQ